MRKGLFAVCLVSLFALWAAGPAKAQSPHFISASANIDSSTGDLIVSWKEAGLGNLLPSPGSIDYEATAEATATYGCINGGGKHPKATNKETVSGPVNAGGSFPIGKNGQITASLTITPPGPGDFSCPAGQTLELGTVNYIVVSLVDTTNKIDASLTGTCASDSGCTAVINRF
jgi:hypothetical protein